MPPNKYVVPAAAATQSGDINISRRVVFLIVISEGIRRVVDLKKSK